MRFPIYCNFKSETEQSIHTISGITVNFLKPGLEDEALGDLSDFTPDRLYHLLYIEQQIRIFKLNILISCQRMAIIIQPLPFIFCIINILLKVQNRRPYLVVLIRI
jgi:hypothetical protein